jgi:cysteine-rich repeat protein
MDGGPDIVIPLLTPGDNGVAIVDLGPTPDVATMSVMLKGSGGIDNIVFFWCGDGEVNQAGEECDGTDDAECPGECIAPGEANECTCPEPEPICGDNVVNQETEDCDGTDDDNCPGLCTLNCGCPLPVCGDNVVNQANEECDGTDDDACPGECQQDCTCPPEPICGDNVVNQANEECDGTDDDACPGACQADCTCGPFCGDNNQDPDETCDPPGSPAGDNGNLCRNTCTVCGDGIVNNGEACDDGNGINGDDCDNDCTEGFLVKELLEGPEQIGIYLPTATVFVFEITYLGPAALVGDTVPAEFEIVEVVASDGTAIFFQTGQSGKSATKIEWEVPAGLNTLTVTIQTRPSPGKGHKEPVFKPTSCGPLPLNDGATATTVGTSNALVVEAVEGAKPCVEEEVDKAILRINSAGTGNNGQVKIRGMLDDRKTGGDLATSLLNGLVTLIATDGAEFNAAIELTDCALRGKGMIRCGSPRAIFKPSRKQALVYKLNVMARGLGDSDTGTAQPQGPITVKLEDGEDVEWEIEVPSAACKSRGMTMLVCSGN